MVENSNKVQAISAMRSCCTERYGWECGILIEMDLVRFGVFRIESSSGIRMSARL